MRILLISDIHANWAALDAIREPYDLAICLGDLVEYGPCPVECIRWVRNHCAYTVRGNHDHGSAQRVGITASSGFRYLTQATRPYTINSLTPDDRQYLAELPTSLMLTLMGKRFLLVHASPRDPMDEYVPTTSEAWASQLAKYPVDFLCVGHSHQQFQLQVGQTTVVNPGSVGLPRNGNPDVHYAIIEDGRVELKSIGYNLASTLAALEAVPIEEQARQMLRDVYRFGKIQKPEGHADRSRSPGHSQAAYESASYASGTPRALAAQPR
ncbi:MAG: YfcE family phosphodiesterase [Bacteroidales bacterium]|nr:YfcE family phosphodiesterase [Bacteroidales bacterium]